MKFYLSPLFFLSVFLVVIGLGSIGLALVEHDTRGMGMLAILYTGFPAICSGIVALVIDYIIRSSNLMMQTKLILQVLIVLSISALGWYLLF